MESRLRSSSVTAEGTEKAFLLSSHGGRFTLKHNSMFLFKVFSQLLVFLSGFLGFRILFIEQLANPDSDCCLLLNTSLVLSSFYCSFTLSCCQRGLVRNKSLNIKCSSLICRQVKWYSVPPNFRSWNLSLWVWGISLWHWLLQEERALWETAESRSYCVCVHRAVCVEPVCVYVKSVHT